jgi:hypothetical protein
MQDISSYRIEDFSQASTSVGTEFPRRLRPLLKVESGSGRQSLVHAR